MRTVEQLLDESPALAALTPEHRATMAGCARLRVFAPGERLLREGDPADEFFLIRSGAVAVETEVPGRGAATLETLGPAEILGWSWLVPPYRSAFGARALDAVHVVTLDGACLRGKCERDPALGYALLKLVSTVFVRRLEETRMRLLDLYAGVPDAG
jgi:CRP/FNR family transcriptional regulator, cyclic AMP receptor protein